MIWKNFNQCFLFQVKIRIYLDEESIDIVELFLITFYIKHKQKEFDLFKSIKGYHFCIFLLNCF